MFQKGKETQEHGTANQGREKESGGSRGGIRGRPEGEDSGAGAHGAPSEGGDRIQKKTACLGGDEKRVRNVDKARIIDELCQGKEFRGRVRLSEWLAIAGLSKSSYENARKSALRPETAENERLSLEIKAIWLGSKRRYGYRKITTELRTRYGEKTDHKKVLRLMNRLGIYAELSGHGKNYSSYRGGVGKTAPNLLKRDFHADASLRKAGTDVTEFKFEWGKAYLSPVIDFHNDEILGYALSQSPNMALIESMLSDLCAKHPLTYNMILHSDQGWQYQMPGYQASLKAHGIIQSMSRKGNCLDNSKTENFFSKLKKEMYYGHEKEFRGFAEFRKAIDEYIRWYNNERIVERFGCAPVGHRSIVPIPMLCYSSL